MPVTTLRRLRQEDGKFQPSLGYTDPSKQEQTNRISPSHVHRKVSSGKERQVSVMAAWPLL